jgi:hypothetical protein
LPGGAKYRIGLVCQLAQYLKIGVKAEQYPSISHTYYISFHALYRSSVPPAGEHEN